MGWHFRDLLLSGGVDALQQYPSSNPGFLWHMSEMVYIAQASIGVQNQLLHEGIFPAWTPFAAGGTPLIAKMQNGFFGLHHVLLHAFPLDWAPRLYTAVIILKNFLAFFSTFLLARCLGLRLSAAIFAGVWFISSSLYAGGIFTWPGAALAMPMALLLVELLFRRQAALAAILLPWAIAIPFLSGHFESGVYNFGATLFYFLLRWRQDAMGAAASWKPFWIFAGAAAGGVLLACAQALASVEYVNHSYSRIWHDRRFFGFWDWDTVNKHLSGEDVPLLLLGWAAAAGFAWSLRLHLRAQSPAALWRRAGAACAFLALSIGCLSILGLQESLSSFAFQAAYNDFGLSLTGLTGLVLALWAWSTQPRSAAGLKALGWLLAAELLLLMREPGIANAIIHIPLFNNFHNAAAQYRWDFQLSRAVLCALALQKCMELAAQPAALRRQQAWLLARLLLIVSAGYLGGLALKAPLIRALPSAAAWRPGYDGAAGHFTTAEKLQTMSSSLPISGWAAAHKPVASVEVGVLQGNNLTAVEPAELREDSPSGPRRHFLHNLRRLPGMPAEGMLAARVRYSDGSAALIPGPDYFFRVFGQGTKASWLLLAALLATPFLLLLPGWALKLACLALCLAPLRSMKASSIPADQIPFRLPAVDKILQDDHSGPFRITSLEYNFLQADYAGLYGLGDVRTGGDSIDVLSAIYFYHLIRSFTEGGDAEKLRTAFKLLGLAGVKYLAHPPDRPAPRHPSLEKFYEGPDMSVWRNTLAMPRALFFDQAAYLPLGNLYDWANRDRFMGPLFAGLQNGQLDPSKVLVLHDAPKESFPEAAVGAQPSTVTIENYGANRIKLSVEAARPGFVFLSDTFFPGWKALRNGRPAQILRAWLNFRAVPVPQGKSVVEFVYRPLPLAAGIAAAATASLTWIFLYGAYRRRRLDWLETAFAPAPPQAEGKKKKNPTPPLYCQEDPLARRCARALESVLITLIGANLAYWLFWTAFVCRSAPANAAARILLGGMIVFLALPGFFGRIRQSQLEAKEPT